MLGWGLNGKPECWDLGFRVWRGEGNGPRPVGLGGVCVVLWANRCTCSPDIAEQMMYIGGGDDPLSEYERVSIRIQCRQRSPSRNVKLEPQQTAASPMVWLGMWREHRARGQASYTEGSRLTSIEHAQDSSLSGASKPPSMLGQASTRLQLVKTASTKLVAC